MAETPCKGISTVTGPVARLSLVAVMRPIAAHSSGVVRISVTRRIVNVEFAASELDGHCFRRAEIDHVDRARADQLGNAFAAGCFQPVGPGAHDPAHQFVCEFCGRQVENSLDCAVFDQLLHRLAASTRGMKNQDIIASLFEEAPCSSHTGRGDAKHGCRNCGSMVGIGAGSAATMPQIAAAALLSIRRET